MENLGPAKGQNGVSSPKPIPTNTTQPPTKVISPQRLPEKAVVPLRPLSVGPSVPSVTKPLSVQTEAQAKPKPLSVPAISVPPKTVALSVGAEKEVPSPARLSPSPQVPAAGRSFSTSVPPVRTAPVQQLDPYQEAVERPIQSERRVLTIRDL